ncbi:PHA/PHB synthase family protein [Acuticoccus mangrovi]|uniref:Polyhydroxyalkanoic acid synthase n=1 Tax=Acuticoccus mangrovi TaxID=2796142 RepID=A0A934IRQ9_9HYPH|nr:alpha/beta fold hydrolase [Acuticoccus mangrovi]MBJ3777531.1 polyhydroxyalkanoic acid synthase [Acuticoccus mangrovi]
MDQHTPKAHTHAHTVDDAADDNGDAYRAIDRLREALAAQVTLGLSPAAVALATIDWAMHLSMAPGKRMELADKAVRKATRLAAYVGEAATHADATPAIAPLPGDRRFASEGWSQQPYAFLAQAFLLNQQWWHNVTHGVPGVSQHHQDVVAFATRQLLDMASPSNTPFTNPEVIDRTITSAGANLLEGYFNFVEDVRRNIAGEPPAGTEAFVPGKTVAVTPGKVIYRNHLIELIQYAPTTDEVLAEPVLIVPAWIMKYYILDLSVHNSLVRDLVSRGHTVFCISWRNPTADDRDMSLDDYRRDGVMAALDAVNAVVPDRKIHATGYCLGGTLLSIAAAAMARVRDDRLASVTMFAAQTDFTEPGELALFIDDSQMHVLDSIMWHRGYLASNQMAGAFQMLRSNDLVWSRIVHDYMMGERTPMNDLMAWNADATRMPYRMHSEYLRRLYLHNELAAGRLMVDGHPAALQNIRVPMFVVGTERDHVAPWHSVYKIHYLTDTDVTFVLTSGGHNAGIVSEPHHPHRHYRIALKRITDPCISAEEWFETAPTEEGSWWPAWSAWLAAHSPQERVAPPPMGVAGSPDYAPREDAPGTYVFQR